ncbi:ATP-binding cassette domain-containing protein [Francisellaceae bacterium]|nr:ATP-binding cassette domain-containing protein [Francisellaceae bacterium]
MIYINVKGNIGHCVLNTEIELPSKGITAIMGPSGSGKSTLLNCIAGINKVKNSVIKVDDICYQSPNHFLPLNKRKLAYVFQRPYLLPHLTVQQNLTYSFKRSIFNKKEPVYDEVIQILSIENLLPKVPSKLSGGQLQRCCIAQALLSSPDLLMLDEPFSALDHTLKQKILVKLKDYISKKQMPVIYVTHSNNEIDQFADQVILFENGICQHILTIEAFKKRNISVDIETLEKSHDGYKLTLSNGIVTTIATSKLEAMLLNKNKI